MKKIVFTFGRMNPISKGHGLLASVIMQIAKRDGATPRIYLSHTKDPKKNPLDYRQKILYAQAAFGPKVVKASGVHNLIGCFQDMEKDGFTDVVMVVGSDQVPEFAALVKKYNGKEFKFASVRVISAGERDPDADDVTGMSASKMRSFVAAGDKRSFIAGAPIKLSQKQKLAMFNDVAAGMNLREDCYIEEESIMGMKTFTDLLSEARKSDHGGTDGEDAGDSNIIYQMRKVIALRGRHPVKHANGDVHQMNPMHAAHIIKKYTAIGRPIDKQKFTRKIAKSKEALEKELYSTRTNVKPFSESVLDETANYEVLHQVGPKSYNLHSTHSDLGKARLAAHAHSSKNLKNTYHVRDASKNEIVQTWKDGKADKWNMKEAASTDEADRFLDEARIPIEHGGSFIGRVWKSKKEGWHAEHRFTDHHSKNHENRAEAEQALMKAHTTDAPGWAGHRVAEGMGHSLQKLTYLDREAKNHHVLMKIHQDDARGAPRNSAVEYSMDRANHHKRSRDTLLAQYKKFHPAGKLPKWAPSSLKESTGSDRYEIHADTTKNVRDPKKLHKDGPRYTSSHGFPSKTGIPAKDTKSRTNNIITAKRFVHAQYAKTGLHHHIFDSHRGLWVHTTSHASAAVKESYEDGLVKKSLETGIPYSVLEDVYLRGLEEAELEKA